MGAGRLASGLGTKSARAAEGATARLGTGAQAAETTREIARSRAGAGNARHAGRRRGNLGANARSRLPLERSIAARESEHRGSATSRLLLPALAACLALTAVLFAPTWPVAWADEDDGSPSIALEGATDGTYYAYKLMDGSFTYNDEGELVMGDAYLEKDVGDLVLEALADYGYEVETSNRSRRAIANSVMDAFTWVEDDGNAQALANDLAGALESASIQASAEADASNGSATLSGLDEGYYLVAQKSTEAEAMTSALLLMLTADGLTIEAKVTTPTTTKSVAGEDGEYGTTADMGVAETEDGTLSASSVTYRIVGTVASNVEDYESYYYSIVDELPETLEVDDSSRVAWSIKAVLDEKETDISEGFACTVELSEKNGDADETSDSNDVADSNEGSGNLDDASGSDSAIYSSLSWTTEDLLAVLRGAGVDGELADVQIVLVYSIEYSSEELEAICAASSSLDDPQTNTAHIVFSNNPYAGGEGSTSETPDDQTRLYTFNLGVLKVDEDGESLAGAVFTLTDSEGNTLGSNITADDDGTFTFTGLQADVEYTLTETSVPAGHKSIDPIRFVLEAVESTDGETVTGLNVIVEDDPSSASSWSLSGATATAVVVNLEGDDLPLTGLDGIATKVCVGLALVACGLGIWAVARRKGHGNMKRGGAH